MRLLVCAAFVLGCGKHAAKQEPPPPKAAASDALAETDEPAPRFDITKLLPLEMADLENRKVRFGDQLRDVNVIAFWASWCHPCLDELPQLDVLYRKLRDNKRVAIIAINVADERAGALAELDRLKLTLPVLFDANDASYHLLLGGGSSIMIPAIAIFTRDRPIASDTGNDDPTTDELVARLQKQIDIGLAAAK